MACVFAVCVCVFVFVFVLGMSYGRHVYVGVKTLSIAALDDGGS